MAAQIAKSTLYMADPSTKQQYMAMAKVNINRLLVGETPRLIDEWQLVPSLWDAVRGEIDKRDEEG